VQPDVKTIRIDQFANEAPLSVPNLAQVMSDAVRDRFINQSRLSLVPTGGDLVLTATITQYQILAQNINSANTAAQNRLTMTARVKFQNTRYPDQSWEENFTTFTDFPASENLGTLQTSLNQDLCNRMAQDIFNKALSDW
jgi:hypothetical protein